MMSWNYRVCKITYNQGTDYEEVSYEIREAYYNKDGGIWAVTENPKGIAADSEESILTSLEWMKQAVERPVLDLDTFVFADSDFGSEDISDED